MHKRAQKKEEDLFVMERPQTRWKIQVQEMQAKRVDWWRARVDKLSRME